MHINSKVFLKHNYVCIIYLKQMIASQ